MCGIYGFLGKPTKKTTGIIRKLGILNQSRGYDSTGLAFTSPSVGDLYKDAVPAREFFQRQDVVKLMCKYRKMAQLGILGHTRLATHGVVTSESEHPFDEDGLVFHR